ncbi:MAG: hypothetical protein LC104_07930 [Bacteroidales bacterium]|nr:hypothetical protein [Bacteroidales bacterium]
MRVWKILRDGWLPTTWILLILLWLSVYVRWGLSHLTVLEFGLWDGPFQVFNPLRRILAGQRGGVDFQFFHGLGVPYIHYPIYRLMGSDLFAAEVSRVVVSPLGTLLGWIAFFAALTKRFQATLGLTMAAIVCSELFEMHWLYMPMHSLPGVRAAAPAFVAAVLLLGLRPMWEAVLVGAATGLALFLGTEHGAASCLGLLGGTWIARWWYNVPGCSLRWSIISGVSTFGTYVGILTLIGGVSGAQAAILFAFRDIPVDQIWYFSSLPGGFIASISQALSDRNLIFKAIGPVVVTFALVAAAMRRDAALRPLGCTLLGFLVYGLASTIPYTTGMISEHYLLGCQRVLIFTWLALGWWWLGSVDRAIYQAAVIGATLLILSVGPTWRMQTSIWHVQSIVHETGQLAKRLRDDGSQLGPISSDYLQSLSGMIDDDRAHRGITSPPRIWSCYAGLIESHYGIFHPYCDYMIHALGQNGRTAYLEAFRQSDPEYVVVFHRERFEFQSWLEITNWLFFEELLLNYECLGHNVYVTLWRRRSGPWQQAIAPTTEVPTTSDSFSLTQPNPASEEPIIVEVEYETKNHLRPLPLVGNLPRFLIKLFDTREDTTISLPPYTNRHRFPVYPRAGKTPRFFAYTVSPLGMARLKLRSVRVRWLDVDGRDRDLTFGLP